MASVPSTTFELVAPPGGALAAFHLTTDTEQSCDALVRRLRLGPLPTGSVALRPLAEIDTAIAARPTPTAIIVTPHAGAVITTRLVRWLTSAGVTRKPADPTARYPEASDLIEACMLDALASASSSLAIDVLLRQPALWRSRWPASPEPCADRATEPDATHDRVLARLLTPPLVVAVGHTNIGKSTLVNVLARRTVAVAADMPGTTRDHVGVTLDLAGLVVRWIDTPGLPRSTTDIGDNPIESEALALARAVISDADLILSCADATAPFLDAATLNARPGVPVLQCATRADLAPAPPASITCSAARLQGLDTLAATIRDALIPPAAIASDVPWHFHPALAGPPPAR
jgi:small GTP-binding protein